jgi:hypothetical protein
MIKIALSGPIGAGLSPLAKPARATCAPPLLVNWLKLESSGFCSIWAVQYLDGSGGGELVETYTRIGNQGGQWKDFAVAKRTSWSPSSSLLTLIPLRQLSLRT